ncbi:hypothetical protein M3Y99_00236200 [Aphelenchoides fujianensis]|nr:hypothetical protein M3Y99_00236200 [Aphelenchoides fujianensis]
MEAAVVKSKPQMRAAVRVGLNRFQLVDKMETDMEKGTAQLKRLALISRAHLASVRRSARGIKFEQWEHNWRLQLDLGIGAPKTTFPATQTEMRGIVKLLAVPIHVDLRYNHYWHKDVACKKLKGVESFVNCLTVRDYSDFAPFGEYNDCVAPHLKQPECPSDALPPFPPLDLERLVFDYTAFGVNYDLLSRYKIRRLDVPMWEITRDFMSDPVLSTSITSLGLNVSNAINFRHELIEAFCRRFSALEELHICVDFTGPMKALDEHFTNLWAACLELRDRLNISGFKRLFFTFDHDCNYFTCENSDWIEKLKQVEPFDQATFTVDRFTKDVRMFLKHNRPRDAKAVFVCIKSDFRCRDDDSTDEDESDSDEEMDEDLDGFDEDGMDDADAD